MRELATKLSSVMKPITGELLKLITASAKIVGLFIIVVLCANVVAVYVISRTPNIDSFGLVFLASAPIILGLIVAGVYGLRKLLGALRKSGVAEI